MMNARIFYEETLDVVPLAAGSVTMARSPDLAESDANVPRAPFRVAPAAETGRVRGHPGETRVSDFRAWEHQ